MASEKHLTIHNSAKVALIGCGRVAGHHLRSITQVEGGEIVAVCDLDAAKAEAYGKEYGIRAFTNYHTMLRAMPEIDIVAIITPSGMHYEHALEVMVEYGKRLIVEKPTFMKPSQVMESYDRAAALGLEIFPVFQNRHNKAVRRVKAALDNGELGRPRILAVRVRWCRPQRYYNLAPWRGTFSHDGGALTNQGVHHIDLLRYLGGEVARVNATMRTIGADIEVEDTVVATVEFVSGAVGVVEVTTAARPNDYEASLSLVCEKGLAQLGGIAVNELQVFTPDPAASTAHSEIFPDPYGFGHTEVYRGAVDRLLHGTAFAVGRADCLATIKLLDSFYRSDETGTWAAPDEKAESGRLGRPDEAISDLYRTPRP